MNTSFKRSMHKQTGFSLIEALITFIILAVGLLALFNFQGASLKNSADAKNRAEASDIAKSKLDDLMSFYCLEDCTTASGSGSGSGIPEDYVNRIIDGSATIDGTAAQYSVSWTTIPDGSHNNLYVTVAWTDTEDNIQTVALEGRARYHSPGEEAVRFQNHYDHAHLATSSVWTDTGSGTTPGDGTDPTPPPTGAREIIETVIDENGDTQYIYRIKISGDITAQNNNEDAEVVTTIDAADVQSINGGTEIYRAWCTFDGSDDGSIGDTYFECWAYYSTTVGDGAGWSGTITFNIAVLKVAGNNISVYDAEYCSPDEAALTATAGIYVGVFRNIETDLDYPIEVSQSC